MSRLKLCGMRTLHDIEVCRKADYLGFVVLSDSPRSLELDQARDLMSVCDGARVAVTTETRLDVLRELIRKLDPDVLQLHSPLDLELSSRLHDQGVPLWGVLPVREGTVVDANALSHLDALLLDSPGPKAGGNGMVHDWTVSAALRRAVGPLPVVLAGGLDAQNLPQAIGTVRPFAVDISSGAEENGRKDRRKVTMIMESIRGAIK